jgi:hypothetical protein
MNYIDVFNGDADGICALHQLRLAEPRPDAMLVTGVKRDIRLLQKLGSVQDAVITVLDISLDTNRQELVSLLTANNRVFYADHHFCGEIPDTPNLQAHIDPSPDTCTSLIVDRLLQGRYRGWAVAAAFGQWQLLLATTCRNLPDRPPCPCPCRKVTSPDSKNWENC